MRRPLALLLLAVAAARGGAQAPASSAPVPRDPAVRAGTLPNGLRYLIRRNGKPEKRAELRLVVNAGSILETDAQRGLAHFVEHMAFNGTRRFPKAAIVNYLERVGMRFGADLNAGTSFDETIYELQIPTDTLRLLHTGLDILEDWAHGVSFDRAEIAKERGVVIEEWRSGRDASTRVQNRQFPVMLQGSKYAVRLPIGTKENLESFPDSLLRAFYRDWYRPDLMTVIAVGDFDVAEMQRAITERFSRVPKRAAPRPRELAAVPDHAETLVSIETDKEYPYATVGLLWLKPHRDERTVGDFRTGLVTSFFDGMLNARLSEITQRPEAPFAFASGGRGEFVRTKDAYQLFAGVKESGFASAAQALLAEAERVSRFGFTQSELDRQRTNLLRSYEQRFLERDKSNSAQFVQALVSHALTGDPFPSIGQEQELVKALAPSITVEEVNALAKSSFTETNRVVLVAAPEKPEVKVPDAAAMLAIFSAAKTTTLAAYVDSTSDAPLVPTPPKAGRIVAERTLPETGILEWTLSNGAKMLLKPTDFKADEVLFAGSSPGGSSLVSDADLLTADLASTVLSVGGVGDFNQIALRKKLTGKRANATTALSDHTESVRGGASAKDLETMFQLAWLRFTAPRGDSSAYVALANQAKAMMVNQKNEPESVFGDTILVTSTQHHPRVRVFQPAMLDSVSITRTLQLYRERFANAGDFHFFLVGSFSPDSVRPLVERWVASLPSTGAAPEKARDVGIRPPPGIVKKVVRKGVEPKAQTELVFHGSCEYGMASRSAISALVGLLDIRLREVVREDKSGTYGVQVGGTCSSIPYAHYSISISFGSAPERADELVTAVFGVIDEVKRGVVSDSNLTKIREIGLRGHETSLKQNGSWLGSMMDADEDGRDQRDFLRAPDRLKAISREQIRDAARLYLDTGRYMQFTLLPETTTPPAVKP
jgi:zinc protease